MTAKIRFIDRAFEPICQANLPNLLVSGASNTWNNSEDHICTWPYYLRDLCGFAQVLDCSQSGAGCNHVFLSVVNEIETNPAVCHDDTLIICLWPDLTRTDVINFTQTVRDWHHMSLYEFNDKFASFTLVPDSREKNILADLGRMYRRVVDMDAQVYESALKMLSLAYYLDAKQYQWIYLIDNACEQQIRQLPASVSHRLEHRIANVPILERWARSNNQWHDAHPTPDAHLTWVQSYLIPYLIDRNLIRL